MTRHGGSQSDAAASASVDDLVVGFARAQRSRSHFFPGRDFADPAWAILLELFLTDRAGGRISISGACAMSGAPSTTALHIVERMVRDRLVLRTNDPSDKRRSWLTLAPMTRDRLHAYLSLCVGIAEHPDDRIAMLQMDALAGNAARLTREIEAMTRRVARIAP